MKESSFDAKKTKPRQEEGISLLFIPLLLLTWIAFLIKYSILFKRIENKKLRLESLIKMQKRRHLPSSVSTLTSGVTIKTQVITISQASLMIVHRHHHYHPSLLTSKTLIIILMQLKVNGKEKRNMSRLLLLLFMERRSWLVPRTSLWLQWHCIQQ